MQQKEQENKENKKNLAEIENIDLREFGPEKMPTTEKNKEKLTLPEQAIEIGSRETELYLENEGKSDKEVIGSTIRPQKGKEPINKKIETILEEGMDNIFLSMTPVKQQEFKRVGEETGQKIAEILATGKVRIARIIDLIKKWLSLIPGVNKFFIEQEAKIKADKILKIA